MFGVGTIGRIGRADYSAARGGLLLPILDQLGITAAGAYSLRRVRLAAPLACRARRSSDNAELNIGFTASGDLDTAALLAFVGSGNGFVTTWYDQSGNGRNAIQSTAGAQPRIVSNGALETQNGKPTIRQLTGGGGFVASVPITGSTLTANAVASLDDQGVTGFKGLMSISSAGEWDFDSVSRGVLLLQVDAQANIAGFRNAYTSIVGITIGTQFVATSVYDGTNNILWKDGSAGPTVPSTGNFSTTLLSIGERLGPGVSSPWIGTFSEKILFTSALSTTERETLETNQGAYYGITVA
jgi:hypothetical protein